jgi:hypothetical protein
MSCLQNARQGNAMANKLTQLMPTFARHEGFWTGSYHHITPGGLTIDKYNVHIRAEYPIEPACDFRLHTRNVWADGQEQSGIYEAQFRDGKLHFERKLIGQLWDVDDCTSYLRFTFEDARDIEVFEMIQISPDGQSRARTWHWFRDHQIFQLTLTDERRASSGP